MGKTSNRGRWQEGCVVLVVDDSDDTRELICHMLLAHGADVIQAANGRDALDLLLLMHRLPCLILLDLDMPIMSGSEFLDARSKLSQFAVIPVLVTSGSAERSRSKLAAYDTVVDYLPKPLDCEVLWQKVLVSRSGAGA